MSSIAEDPVLPAECTTNGSEVSGDLRRDSEVRAVPSHSTGCSVPVWVTIACVAVLAAVVSFGGGLYLYFRSKDSVERRVTELSNAEVRYFGGLLRESFVVTEERAWSIVDNARAITVDVRQGWEHLHNMNDAASWSHTLSKNRTDARVTGSGLSAWPAATGLRDAPETDVVMSYVWWDPLKTGKVWYVQGMPVRTADGKFASAYYEMLDPEHSLWNRSTEAVDRLDWYESHEECDVAPGSAFWNEPSTWLKDDGDVALYVHFTVVFTFEPIASRPSVGTMVGCADAETDLVHWDKQLGIMREISSGELYVVDLELGVVLAHTHEPRPPPSKQCEIEETTGVSTGKVHGCFPRVADYGYHVQALSPEARSMPYDRVIFRSGKHGGHYIQRHHLWTLPGPSGVDYKVDAVWYRDAGPIQDEIDESLYGMVGFVVGAVVFNIALSLVQMSMIGRPIMSLAQSVELLGNMDIEAAEENHASHSHGGLLRVTEVVRLTNGFEKACVFLREWRSFVPESMRAAGRQSTSAFADTVDEEAEGSDLLVRGDTAATAAASRQERGSVRRAWSADGDDNCIGREDSQLTPVTRFDQPGATTRVMQRLTDRSLRRRSGTAVQADFGLAAFINSGATADLQQQASKFVLQELPGALSAVTASGGITQLLSADLLIATWHTHKPCPDHSFAAAQCAIRIGSTDESRVASTGCACGMLIVGHAGNAESRHPVLLGEPLWQADALCRLGPTVGAPVLITHGVYVATTGRLRACVVDIIASEAGRMVKVYELLPEIADGASAVSPAYLEAFSALCKMDLDRCRAALIQQLREVPGDRHAVRLLRVALALRSATDTRKEYCRKAQPVLEPLERLMPDLELPPELEGSEVAERWKQLNDPKRKPSGQGRLADLRQGYGRHSLVADDMRLRAAIEKELGQSLANPLEPPGRSPPVSPTRRQAGGSDSGSSTSSGPRRGGGLRPAGGMQRQVSTASSADSDEGVRGTMGDATSPPISPPGNALSSTTASGATTRATMRTEDQDLPMAVETHSGGTSKRWTRSGKVLGRGAFGEVWMGMGEDGALVALKALPLVVRAAAPQKRGDRVAASNADTSEIEALIQEVSLMVSVRHDNVVSYLGSCVVPGHIVIVMEYLSGGSLQGLLEQFGAFSSQVPALRRYLIDIICGLAFLHDQGIIHRDLKPHNVLLTIEGQCKLADFGTSGKISDIAARAKRGQQAMAGTPLYMSPEAAMGAAGPPADVWALGVMICQLWTGQLPYVIGDGFNLTFFLRKLAKDPSFGPKIPEDMPAELTAMVRGCLDRDADTRPSASALQNDPFLL